MTHVTVVAIYEFLTWSKKTRKTGTSLIDRTDQGGYVSPALKKAFRLGSHIKKRRRPTKEI